MGLDNLEKLLDESNFPWLLSNVYDSQTESTLLKLDTQVVFNIDNVKVFSFYLDLKKNKCMKFIISRLDFLVWLKKIGLDHWHV